jgi:Uncharacterised nucleotidyltransferase
MTRAEVTTMLGGVATYGLPGSPSAASSKPLDHDDWHLLLAHVRRERITGLLAEAISTEFFPATDTQATEAFDLSTEVLATELTLEATLLQVAETFENEVIPFRVLKGPAVAHLDYPDAALRDFGDIDLLIRPDDLDRTIALLNEQGFARRFPEPRAGFDRRFTKSVSVVNPGGQELDLHRTLAPGVFGLRVRVETLWDASPAQFVLGDRTLVALGSAERFIHACYHAVLGNAPPRLVPLRDIAQMLLCGSVAPNQVQTVAAAWRGEAVVKHAIMTAWAAMRLTDVVALSSWAAQDSAGSQQRELARALSLNYSYTAQALDSVRAIPTVRDRLRYVSALAFPRRSYLSGRYSGHASRFGHAVTELFNARTSSQPVVPVPAGASAHLERQGDQ